MGNFATELAEFFWSYAVKGVEMEEGHTMPNHIHMLLSVPPKCSVAMTIGYLKSKSAILIVASA